MTLPDQQTSLPGTPDSIESPGNQHHAAGWMLIANLFLGCLFFLEFQWYLENIYRHSPWIPFVSLEQIDTVVDLVWGAFMLHVGAPLARAKFEGLKHPSKLLAADAHSLFSHPRTAVVASVLVAGVYALILLSPALHLVYMPAGEQPVVEMGGSRKYFQGTSIPLFDADPGQTELRVTDKHGLYQVRLQPTDIKSYWPFLTHQRVDLDRFFIHRDLAVTLHDADQRMLAAFNFEYEREQGLANQCRESELPRFLGENDRGCSVLVRRILSDMASNPEARLLSDYSGSVPFENRTYGYDYSFGTPVRLSILAPEADSELANNPHEALERFRSANTSERALLVSEFGKDVASLSSSALESVFQDLFATKNLLSYLDGTTAQKRDTLAFVRDVLAIGSDHVVDENIDDLAALILERNLIQVSPATVFVPAIDAVIALSEGKHAIRRGALEHIEQFVAELGTNHNSAKPEIARILLQALDEQTTASDEGQIVPILITLGRNAIGVDSIVGQMESDFHERIKQISNPQLSQELREAMGAWNQPSDSLL